MAAAAMVPGVSRYQKAPKVSEDSDSDSQTQESQRRVRQRLQSSTATASIPQSALSFSPQSQAQPMPMQPVQAPNVQLNLPENHERQESMEVLSKSNQASSVFNNQSVQELLLQQGDGAGKELQVITIGSTNREQVPSAPIVQPRSLSPLLRDLLAKMGAQEKKLDEFKAEQQNHHITVQAQQAQFQQKIHRSLAQLHARQNEVENRINTMSFFAVSSLLSARYNNALQNSAAAAGALPFSAIGRESPSPLNVSSLQMPQGLTLSIPIASAAAQDSSMTSRATSASYPVSLDFDFAANEGAIGHLDGLERFGSMSP